MNRKFTARLKSWTLRPVTLKELGGTVSKPRKPGGPWRGRLAQLAREEHCVIERLNKGKPGQVAHRLSRSCEVMAISRPDGLGDIAALGLTLAEAKQLLVQVQQEVVAAQARQHTLFRPDCQSCSGRCHVKGWRPHRIATLFGEVRVKLPRLACAGGGCGETGGGWPSHCRSTPELDQLQARLSALMPYRVAADVMQHLLPIDAGRSPETLRTHTLQVGKRLGDAAAEKPPAAAAAITISLDSTFIRSREDGGPRRQRRDG